MNEYLQTIGGADHPVAVMSATSGAVHALVAGGTTTILGTEGADTLYGTTSSETILAGAGNDTIYYSYGSDIVDGGAGLDTFVAHSNRYWDMIGHSATEPHTWSVSGMLGSSARLVDVERIRFAEISLALDIDGVAGQAYRLYQAAFNRAPDKFGVGFWISRLDMGVSLKDIAQGFVESAEFKTLYGSTPGNAELVDKFYENVLHRAPDPTGNQFWIDVLDRHAATVVDVLLEFSESAENVAALVGVMNNGIEYLPYA
jgi:hypothetical protein